MVPKLLIPEQNGSRMNICVDILNNIDTDPGLLDTVTLKGTRFESVEPVKTKATEVLNQLTKADFQHCFQQCKSRMEQCRDRQGKYIEGEKVSTLSRSLGLPPSLNEGYSQSRSRPSKWFCLRNLMAFFTSSFRLSGLATIGENLDEPSFHPPMANNVFRFLFCS
ncbi:hypothetical protein NQ318_022643 [Aromia moschata]|uniref:Uncharacterized protein n=1 Tax=Aromia moschata TaxID=1265417 RepID=A0AAV8YK49_9CUCU|nr:hypothetical protein NQ318_022643 [Aromia moschata]